jgi:hypothetical protein
VAMRLIDSCNLHIKVAVPNDFSLELLLIDNSYKVTKAKAENNNERTDHSYYFLNGFDKPEHFLSFIREVEADLANKT